MIFFFVFLRTENVTVALKGWYVSSCKVLNLYNGFELVVFFPCLRLAHWEFTDTLMNNFLMSLYM